RPPRGAGDGTRRLLGAVGRGSSRRDDLAPKLADEGGVGGGRRAQALAAGAEEAAAKAEAVHFLEDAALGEATGLRRGVEELLGEAQGPLVGGGLAGLLIWGEAPAIAKLVRHR